MTHKPDGKQLDSRMSMLNRYRRAVAIEQSSYSESMVTNANIYPYWIDNTDCFHYIRTKGQGVEYRLVDAKRGENTKAFDHKELASALAGATGESVSYKSLPITNLDLSNDAISFHAFQKRWVFDRNYTLVKSPPVYPEHWLVSPDGKKAVYVKDYNLWLIDFASGEERALTQNGCKHYAYAVQPESRDLLGDMLSPAPEMPPEAIWSPDSSRLFTMQVDERKVRALPSMLYVPRHGSVAPKSVERRCALPGDRHTSQYRMLIIAADTAAETSADYPPVDDAFIWLCPFSGNLAWWSSDGHYAYFVDMARGQKAARLIRFDAKTGAAKVLFEETSETFIDLSLDYEYPSMLKHIPDTNEILWFSERSGWGHIYLYDLDTGTMKMTVTSGEWIVRDILYFDKEKRELLIQIAGRIEGRNPYYREIAWVNVDNGEMNILISGDYDYCVRNKALQGSGVSPSGDFIVATRTRVDEPPITALYDREGVLLFTLESADISGLPAGWQWPEPVIMKADDDSTDVYGVLFRPSDFEPNKKYPVLDFGIVTPFYSLLPTGAFVEGGRVGPLGADPVSNHLFMTLCALAELGFIVVVIDGRGTPYRSKAFHDFCHGSFMDMGGIADHVTGIKQLGERYSFMDMDRVGIVSTDAPGNGSVFGLLNYPDFYKVGVAFSIWDPRLVKQGEVYPANIDEQTQGQSIWSDAVRNLRGKLLLIAGLLDPYFHSSMTFQLVDELVKANKDYDLIIQPYGGHGGRVENTHRRVWDYLVRHLLNAEPPENFKLVTAAAIKHPELMPELTTVDDS